MTLTTYVNFAGRCAEAFRYYEKHLGGKVGIARMAVAGTELSGADIPKPSRCAAPTCRWTWIALLTLIDSGSTG
jgi:hypothetical protein